MWLPASQQSEQLLHTTQQENIYFIVKEQMPAPNPNKQTDIEKTHLAGTKTAITNQPASKRKIRNEIKLNEQNQNNYYIFMYNSIRLLSPTSQP